MRPTLLALGVARRQSNSGSCAGKLGIAGGHTIMYLDANLTFRFEPAVERVRNIADLDHRRHVMDMKACVLDVKGSRLATLERRLLMFCLP